MFWKKKYERSEWYKGLLEGERLFSEGFSKDYTPAKEDRSCLYIWFTRWNGDSKTSVGIDCYEFERCQGIIDYSKYYEKYLN